MLYVSIDVTYQAPGKTEMLGRCFGEGFELSLGTEIHSLHWPLRVEQRTSHRAGASALQP